MAKEIEKDKKSRQNPPSLLEVDDEEEGEEKGAAVEEKESKLLVVVMMGAPGSGKTTFCNDVAAAARRPWVRICQDTIANGKAGTKIQCLAGVGNALKDGKNVLIDRCNLEKEQRTDFVKLGGAHADVHAVVLDLPARLCISRSVKRTGHEGNLQGGKAAIVVNRMLQKKELPKLSEGFSRITFCQNENDVKEAVKIYSSLGPSDCLLAGVFGQKDKEAKVQLGIMKFLKKVDKPDTEISGKNVLPDGNNSQDSVPQQDCMNITSSMELDDIDQDDVNVNTKGSSEKCSIADIFPDGVHTLAFPSISTSDFQFDQDKASTIIVDTVADFLENFGNVRLVLVDLSHKSKILSLVKEKAAKRNIDSNKFFTFVGDITRLYTNGNLRCNVIANAANWRLKPGGGGVNAAIFRAAGEALEISTKERADTLSPGSSVAVPLPSTSPLYSREGVTHVIHVLGPNMNPQRPNFLKNDYAEGCRILRDAYSSLFKNFALISNAQMKNKRNAYAESGSSDNNNNFIEGITTAEPKNSDQKIKPEGCHDTERFKKCKGATSAFAVKDKLSTQHGSHDSVHFQADSGASTSHVNSSNSPDSNVLNVMSEENRKSCEIVKKTWGSWAQALSEIASHPEKHKNDVVETSDDYVVINDLYPKAKKHLLVVSRFVGLDCLADVQKGHLFLLKKMHYAGLKWAEKFQTDNPSLIFRLGYHSVPSMRQLHLHVVSQDFDSIHLKNKKHWNSFTTPFFRDSIDVIEEIEKDAAAVINDDEKFLKMELRCHRCRSAHPNIPRLKTHVANCKASFPSHLLQNGRLVTAM